MLQLNSITLHLGERTLFDGVSALINPGERVGLVGPNGAGKSTLLKMIASELRPDEGEITLSGDSTVGYLPQDGVEPAPGKTVFEEVEHSFVEILRLREEVAHLQKQMEVLPPDSDEYEKTLEK